MLYSEQAERTVLGCLIQDAPYTEQQVISLRQEMFYLDSHRRIFGAALAMLQRNESVDVVTVSEQLKKTSELNTVGGLAYLWRLTEDIPARFNVEAYAKTVAEYWRRREVVRIGSSFAERAKDAGEEAGNLLSSMQAAILDALAETGQVDEPLVQFYSVEAIENFSARAKMSPSRLMGMSFGCDALDQRTDGMLPGLVTVVGARSGVGKSSLMLQAARANARQGIPVHIFSLEMTREQCLQRLWSLESGVAFRVARKPSSGTEAEVEAIKAAAWRIAEWPLRIHDRSDMDVNQISALARLSVRHHGTKLVCVDYAQNVAGDAKDERSRVAKVSSTLTKLAKDEGNHLMLLSQLRKVPPEMYSKPPHVGDLRETGQIENDAHTVILIHRPWNEDLARIDYSGEFIVPKHREGEPGAERMTFNSKTLAFA